MVKSIIYEATPHVFSPPLYTCSLLGRNEPYITFSSLLIDVLPLGPDTDRVHTHRKRQIDYSCVSYDRNVYIYIGHGNKKYGATNVHGI
jgi:hypothetical protein